MHSDEDDDGPDECVDAHLINDLSHWPFCRYIFKTSDLIKRTTRPGPTRENFPFHSLADRMQTQESGRNQPTIGIAWLTIRPEKLADQRRDGPLELYRSPHSFRIAKFNSSSNFVLKILSHPPLHLKIDLNITYEKVRALTTAADQAVRS